MPWEGLGAAATDAKIRMVSRTKKKEAGRGISRRKFVVQNAADNKDKEPTPREKRQ
jgi:hypothetical protein